ncbi:YbaB/EbfC family nucleoid-associated protein [Actinoplanes sp. HUAS TT8]|uniref:YbaB/EbfC family nucleoid-associated protein n=1 Tax=Actinoplanes sp. HUAS TT8 TaxID=3447453 RepID=UPI003F51D7E1
MSEQPSAAASAELRSSLQDVYGGYEQYQDLADQFERDLATMRVSAASPDGAVVATVDSAGRLVDLRLRPPPGPEVHFDDLAAAIVTTVRQATADAARQVQQFADGQRAGLA